MFQFILIELQLHFTYFSFLDEEEGTEKERKRKK